jgi:N-acetylglucosaminyldiphosphoundecaprenol N-acetyl-beta-D-mannosaminyltransferase
MSHTGNPSIEAVPDPVRFLGIPIHPVSPSQVVRFLIQWGREDTFRRVCYVNVNTMNLAHWSGDLRRYLEKADLVFCDGFGVKWMAKILNLDIPCRLVANDFIDDFAVEVSITGQGVFVLGDEDGVADRFGELLVSRHPGYRHVGSYPGFFEKTGPENDAVVRMINESGAKYLLVGFGTPLQERWIEQNSQALQVQVAVCVGALFRSYTGLEKRAPPWMAGHGLEWLHRLVRHPLRHFRRYVVGNPELLARVLRARFPGKS